jgi:1-deoxy-D-xylulose-5-phosphate reductoisomerase
MSSPPFADGSEIGPGRGPVRRIAVLGSTGSIGRQALEVIQADPSMQVVALAAGRNAALLAEQATQLRPAAIAIADESARAELGELPELPAGIAVGVGPDALLELAIRDDVDLVLVGTSGIVALAPVLAALRASKVVATANKETLVAGGHLVMPLARALADRHHHDAGGPLGSSPGAPLGASLGSPLASPLGWLRPIDSEHSAIWQCLVGEDPSAIDRLILTASGGPFRDGPADLSSVTPEMALRHPTWSMGAKITIDSATLANKGLEVIEARWLYDVAPGRIDVVVHPQSIVHSAVLFRDGSLKAQLGHPDMRLPIQYALTHPDRRDSPVPGPDLVTLGRLDFVAPDEARFPALGVARAAADLGSRAGAALIAADEEAVSRFLAGSLSFPGIGRVLEDAVSRFGEGPDQEPDLEALVALDAEVRAHYGSGPFEGPR